MEEEVRITDIPNERKTLKVSNDTSAIKIYSISNRNDTNGK